MPTPSRRRASPEERRAQLLAATLDALKERGLDDVSVDEIVRRAGVAKGTFYLYFKSKEEAVNQLAEHLLEAVCEQLTLKAHDTSQSPVERVFELGRLMVNGFTDARYKLEIVEILHRPENRTFHDRIDACFAERLTPLLERVVADGIEQGVFRPQPPKLAARFMVGVLMGLRHMRDSAHKIQEIRENPEELRRVVEEANVFMLRGLGYTGELSWSE